MEPPKKQISDEFLFSLLTQDVNRERGYKLLMDKYQERLYWHIRQIVSTHEDTDDVLQNTFIKIFKNINRFEGKSSLFTWMYRIATNEALSHLNKTKKRTTVSIDHENFEAKNIPVAEKSSNGEEIIRLLNQAVTLLPPKQKIIFSMRYYDEMSYAEISTILGTSEGGLKASFHHAVKKIEEFLKKQDML